MLLPWFMHAHEGENTLVGVFPTPHGTFVRSWKGDRYDVTWYPIGHDFPKGKSRSPIHLGRFPHVDGPGRNPSELVVVDFMHAHPGLCMVVAYDDNKPAIPWARASRDLLVHETPHGTYTRAIAGGQAVIRFLPAVGGDEIEICRLSTEVAEVWLNGRIAERVDRHMRTLVPVAKAA